MPLFSSLSPLSGGGAGAAMGCSSGGRSSVSYEFFFSFPSPQANGSTLCFVAKTQTMQRLPRSMGMPSCWSVSEGKTMVEPASGLASNGLVPKKWPSSRPEATETEFSQSYQVNLTRPTRESRIPGKNRVPAHLLSRRCDFHTRNHGRTSAIKVAIWFGKEQKQRDA